MKSVIEELASKFIELGAVSAALKEEKFNEICPLIDTDEDSKLFKGIDKLNWVFSDKLTFTFFKEKEIKDEK